MTNDKILDEIAECYGLDREETHLALRYAAAAREATQCFLTTTPDEAKRLKNMKRLASLTLDLYQRLRVAAQLPPVLVDERQSDFAGQLEGTFWELRRLEKTLGEPRTPHGNLLTKVNVRRKVWAQSTKSMPEPALPTTPRAAGRESPPLGV